MMHAHPTSPKLDQSPAVVRAFRSLRICDVENIRTVVHAFGDAWSVQTDDDYDGYLFMMIEPSAAYADEMPSYMVSGRTGEIELAVIRGDDYQTIGLFGDTYGLAAELIYQLLSANERCLTEERDSRI